MSMRLSRGQTLIELLVAIAVITIGLTAALGVVFQNLGLVNRDTDEVIVTNLEREAIESAKQIRDSNWLAGNAFDTGLVNPVDPTLYTATLVWDGSQPQPTTDFSATDLSSANAQVVIATSTDPNGLYANANTAAHITGTKTPFARLYTFHPICSNASDVQTVLNTGTCEAGGLTKVGVRVEVDVKWARQGVTKQRVMYEDLYDWR